MICKKCGKTIDSNKLNHNCNYQADEDIFSGFLAIGALVLGGWATTKILKKGVSLFKEINWDTLSEELKIALNRTQDDLDAIRDNIKRLDRAASLLKDDDKISIDQAAMLSSATLESGLKTLSQHNGIQLNTTETEGMAEIAIFLKDKELITYNECQSIRKFAFKVRNPIMHGDFYSYSKDDVSEQINFTREFFLKYRLIDSYQI